MTHQMRTAGKRDRWDAVSHCWSRSIACRSQTAVAGDAGKMLRCCLTLFGVAHWISIESSSSGRYGHGAALCI